MVYTVTQNSDEVLLPLPADTYSIKVTDGCGATGYATQVIPVYSNPTVSIDVSNLCFGAGQANVIGVNNNPIYPSYYSYQIIAGPTRVGEGPEVDSPPNTGQFSALQSGGTYTFAFSDGCKTVTISATIPNYTQPTWEVGFGALCPPGQTADLQIVNLQPEGQVVGPYHWRIISENSDLYNESLPYPSSVGQTSDIFPDLPPKNASGEVATYNILGNDGCKNSYQGSGKVGELPDETLILNTTTVCADGTTYLRARVSTPIVGATYQYFRDGVMVAQSTTLFTVITPALPGAYSVKVIASQLPDESCFVTAGDVVVTAPVDIVSIVPSACISPSNTYNLDVTLSYATSITSLIIKVNGTDYPVTTNGSGNQTFTISNLTANGAANIPVIIDYGLTSCQPTGEYNAPESCECVPFDVIIPDDTVCPGGTTVLDAGAGSAYLWSEGSTTQTITVGIGTYSVTVTNAVGCTGSGSAVVDEYPPFTVTIPDEVVCPGGTTILDAGAGGAYLWSEGSTTQTITVGMGTYSVTVTNVNSCTAVASCNVTEPPVMDATCSKTDVTTNGGADGTASVSASGGTSPYTYLWNTGATTVSISGLVAGTYSVTVTDANGCTDECTTTVQEPGVVTSASASGTNVLCNGGADGTASATASGNTGAVTYLWSNGATTQNVNSLTAGTYSVTITETPTCGELYRPTLWRH
ncbi:MAG: SprB repeat-containing protein [Sphingobacteriales bacterium]|nr:SprB repeat-containing protein [Sphingobacteriales bacterium]